MKKVHLSITSHASIAYRKPLHPQRTVDTIGSVCRESAPSKETTRPAHTNKRVLSRPGLAATVVGRRRVGVRGSRPKR